MKHDPQPRRVLLLVVMALIWASPLTGQSERVHVVQSGETLFRISTQYGVSVADLSAWNRLTGNTISVGQRLVLQAPEQPTPAPAPVQAQAPAAAQPNRQVIQTRREIVQLEQHYDRYLHGVLAAYFDPATYFVHTRLQIDEVEIGVRERLSEPAPQRRIDQLLPGLPAIPDYLMNTVDAGTEAGMRSGLRATPDIQLIDLEITIDNAYTDEQVAIIRDLATSAAKINTARGDRVRIVRRTLPAKLAEAPVREASLSPLAPTLTEEAWWLNGWLLALAGFAAILLTGAGVYLSRRKPEERPSLIPRVGHAEMPMPISTNGQAVQRITEKIYAGRMDREPSAREWLLNAFMNHMHDMARLLDEWITMEQEIGLERASQVVIAADPKLLEALMPVMDAKNGILLTDRVAQMAGYSSHSDVLSGMVSDTIDALQDRQRDTLCFRLRTLRHFDFAGYVDADHIKQALHDETPLTRAFAIAHMEAAMVDRILATLDEDSVTEIWAEMSRVETISREDYVRLADRLFRRITGLNGEDGTWISMDQALVERACALLERQPIDLQTRLHVRFLSDTSPMSMAVANRLITMANLSIQDPDRLRMAFDEMDIQQLALALHDQNQEVVREALTNRSPRERQMYAAYVIEADSASDAVRDHARQALLQRTRQVLRGPVVMALMLLIVSCSTPKPTSVPEPEPVTATTTPTSTASPAPAPSQAINKDLFDQLHAEYQVLYNRMISDYFQAQMQLGAGQLELARASAIRALGVLPTPQTYELLHVIATRMGNRQDMDRWRTEGDELKTLINQGRYRMPNGEIIQMRKP